MPDERINSITASNYIITLELSHYGTKARVKFNRSCLKQDKATYNHGTMVNIYTVYEISKNYNISSYPALENCLFEPVSLAKHVDIDQHKYSGYGIVFDRKGDFSFGNGFGRNVIILGADMSSSVHANNVQVHANDKEPAWVNKEVRLLFKQKNLMFRIQRKNKF